MTFLFVIQVYTGFKCNMVKCAKALLAWYWDKHLVNKSAQTNYHHPILAILLAEVVESLLGVLVSEEVEPVSDHRKQDRRGRRIVLRQLAQVLPRQDQDDNEEKHFYDHALVKKDQLSAEKETNLYLLLQIAAECKMFFQSAQSATN